jgi:hypothetical protein
LPALSSEGLTAEQYNAAQRFHLKVFGTPMFFNEPVCNGKHGWGCQGCYAALLAVEAERERVASIPQPWHGKQAA